jgi:hypothetical protein
MVGVVAGTLAGLPSTLGALRTGTSLTTSTRAAGALLGRESLVRGVLAHVVISGGWGAVLALVLPRRRTVRWGALGGLLIAGVDLGVVGRRVPAIRRLSPGPQVLDHLAFGALVGWAARRRPALSWPG